EVHEIGFAVLQLIEHGQFSRARLDVRGAVVVEDGLNKKWRLVELHLIRKMQPQRICGTKRRETLLKLRSSGFHRFSDILARDLGLRAEVVDLAGSDVFRTCEWTSH